MKKKTVVLATEDALLVDLTFHNVPASLLLVLLNEIINLEQALFRDANDEYHAKVAETVEEATKLIAVGYEYVSTMDDKQIYRKRK